MALYNEIDPYPAAWLRNLVAAGHIAPGVVDERSVADLAPENVAGHEQAHFFAGIGVWSHALRLAGWADDTPVWTGSCPCQPFSVAGQRKGADDPRHLWPQWFRLIRECRPAVIFGEQVDGAAGRAWLDLVSADLEGCGYAVGAAVLPAAGVGAPHRRHRIFFVADHHDDGCAGLAETRLRLRASGDHADGRGDALGVPDPERGTAERHGLEMGGTASGDEGARGERQRLRTDARHGGEPGSGADADCGARGQGHPLRGGSNHRGEPEVGAGPRGGGGALRRVEPECPRLEGLPGDVRDWRGPGWLDPRSARSASEAGATRGFWGDCDWYWCRDGRWRPIGAGLFPLAHGTPGRLGRLRAYGNAIVPEAAAAFVSAYMEARGR